MKGFLQKLNEFLGRAMLATFAGSGPEADSEIPGFTELEFREKDWYYKDSYTGFVQSWGREVVWFQEKPAWTQIYGGGMQPQHHKNAQFARATFAFLKKCMRSGEKSKAFQPRGPKKFKEGDWRYACSWKGSIKKFQGKEAIYYKNKLVFTHDFYGGLIL